MNPLDPLTEIVYTGQAFSFAITLERIIWIIIGFFFIASILKSLVTGKIEKKRFEKKILSSILKVFNLTNRFTKKLTED